MDIEIREFITYLHNRKRTSHNTEVSYQRDLKKMAVYFADRGIYDIRDVGELELEGYLSYIERTVRFLNDLQKCSIYPCLVSVSLSGEQDREGSVSGTEAAQG